PPISTLFPYTTLFRSCPTVIDILNDWENTEKLLQDAAKSIDASAAVGLPLSELELLAPIPNPGAIYCCGANYTDHNDEMRPMLRSEEHTSELQSRENL